MKKHAQEDPEEGDKEEVDSIGALTFVKLFAGFSLLYVGGELLVKSGSELGAHFGISEYVISAIFVAFGTSFPELVTAILACVKKKETDLITGNIIGSNIFNVAFVLGSLTPYRIAITTDYRTELFLLLGVAITFVAMSIFRLKLNRIFGVVFLGLYFSICYYWVAR